MPGTAEPNRLWLGEPLRVEIDPIGLRTGLNTVQVRCRAPRYVDLGVDFGDERFASLRVPLEAIGSCTYATTISLVAPARRAWMEVRPACEDESASVSVLRLSWRELISLGWRAALRHIRTPRAFLAKARQVVTGGSSLALAANEPEVYDKRTSYETWQATFESAAETERLRLALEVRTGPRPVRVLAVIPPWRFGAATLDDLISSLMEGATVDLHLVVLGSGVGLGPIAAAAVTLERIDCEPSSAWVLPEALLGAMIRTRAEVVIFLERPGRFHPLAVTCLALALATDSSLLAAYGDHDSLDVSGCRNAPVFKPDWSPDYQASCDYVAQPVAFRADHQLFAALGTPGSLQCPSFSVLLSGADQTGADFHVHHIPRVLFHESTLAPEAKEQRRVALLDAVRGILDHRATVSEVPIEEHLPVRVLRYGASPMPRASVIIPTKDNPDLLARACRSVAVAQGVSAELIVVDNGAHSRAQKAVLAELASNKRAQVVSDPSRFNFSVLVNVGRGLSTGDVLVLLNDDVEALDTSWLLELVTQASRTDVGCVGAVLIYPDNRVQHGGILLGISGGAGHAFRFLPAEASGEGARLKSTREVAAVTGACLAVRASVFDAVGGFSEELPVTCNDIDFCLKVLARGYRNIVTPQARLLHRESTTRGLDDTPEKLRRLSRETAHFQRIWGEASRLDPYFSPHFSAAHEDFRPRRL